MIFNWIALGIISNRITQLGDMHFKNSRYIASNSKLFYVFDKGLSIAQNLNSIQVKLSNIFGIPPNYLQINIVSVRSSPHPYKCVRERVTRTPCFNTRMCFRIRNADIYVLDIEQSKLLTLKYIDGNYTMTHVRRLFRDNIHGLPGKVCNLLRNLKLCMHGEGGVTTRVLVIGYECHVTA